MKKIVLFDMDGTLTPPRGKLEQSMANSLRKLQNADFEIGIVTGSDLNYLEEQCQLLFEFGGPDHSQLHYLPCNGTKYYRCDRKWELVKSVDMIAKIGHDAYKTLLSRCMKIQRECVNKNL
jgi:HAD superfamily hydrolase (TIGR01484 family)